jgi:predicted phosphodiesterase
MAGPKAYHPSPASGELLDERVAPPADGEPYHRRLSGFQGERKVPRPELPGERLALIADVHGQAESLREALARCREWSVEGIVLLGDLFDRVDEADACVDALADWPVIGVVGNHEREVVAGAALRRETAAFLATLLEEELVVGDVCFTHHEPGPAGGDPVARFFAHRRAIRAHGPPRPTAHHGNLAHHARLAHHAAEHGRSHQHDAETGTHLGRYDSPGQQSYHILFVGHTHHQAARDDRGPLDLSGGLIQIRKERHYVVNPGALASGQFAVWDRTEATVRFRRLARAGLRGRQG